MAGVLSTELLQKFKTLMEEKVQELGLKFKGELDFITKKQGALHKDFKTVTTGFADRLIVIETRLIIPGETSSPIGMNWKYPNNSPTTGAPSIMMLITKCKPAIKSESRFTHALKE